MSLRPDSRLANAPMQPVTCTACGATVQARKGSWEQTMIQWTREAARSCLERRAASVSPCLNETVFLRCATLHDSVCDAAIRGDLNVFSQEPLPTNPDAHHRKDSQ